jgi:hypothetical protein
VEREVGGKAPACAEGQKVFDGDRTRRGHDVVERALRHPHDHRRRQLREPALDRIGLDLADGDDLDARTVGNERGGTGHRPTFNRRLEQVLQTCHRGH